MQITNDSFFLTFRPSQNSLELVQSQFPLLPPAPCKYWSVFCFYKCAFFWTFLIMRIMRSAVFTCDYFHLPCCFLRVFHIVTWIIMLFLFVLNNILLCAYIPLCYSFPSWWTFAFLATFITIDSRFYGFLHSSLCEYMFPFLLSSVLGIKLLSCILFTLTF